MKTKCPKCNFEFEAKKVAEIKRPIEIITIECDESCHECGTRIKKGTKAIKEFVKERIGVHANDFVTKEVNIICFKCKGV